MDGPLPNNQIVPKLINWLSQDKQVLPIDQEGQCENRDIFLARLDNLFVKLPDPLLIAVCGEIGNNSFDHNLGRWRDLSGVYFNPLNTTDKIIILADRGQGVRATLSRIIPDLPNDVEAVKTAFTKVISGRSPEQRGNGLKFVASAVKKNGWDLYFHSGKGVAQISKGELSFSLSDQDIKGCLAVIKYN